jgi:hypothetical protein
MIDRAPDLFMAGYGAVWTPPPGRGDTSDFTVGYDVYDRFDLGQWDKHTLYGTETSLKRTADMVHRAGLDLHVDFVLNHNGYSDLSTPGFYDAGGYPGLAITLPNDIDGDFHSAYWGGPEYERLAGLIDIAHERDYQFIRNPVDANDSRNIRPGTVPAFGRIANIPDPENARFYPDIGHNTIFVYDPVTGEQNIPVHQFNLADPMQGDATTENATGYLMRNAQWLVQVIGVDGLRIDAAKHVPGFVLDYIDRAVYRQNPRYLLDGSPKHVFSYSEVYDADPAVLHPHVKKTIDPGDPGRIGGNRDTLDFKLYFALKQNLEHGTRPDWDNWDHNRYTWYRIKDAALDVSTANGQGDTLHNGSAGVTFTQSHDVFQPYQLADVAQAYTLLMPGNTVIYFNGKEFGDNREFPKDGRGDALSVMHGSPLTTLLEIRNTHGRGNYAERWVDDQGMFAFERVSSALVLLSNRTDPGFHSRTLEHVGFAPGTHLVELTGHAADPDFDPFNDFPEVVTVFDDAGVNKVNLRFPTNTAPDGDWHNRGYLAYGLPPPEAPAGLELVSGVDSVLPGNGNPTSDYENGINRQTDLHVVKADTLDVRLQTVEVNLLGSIRDVWADGDNALLKLDGGRPINLDGGVDFVTPGEVSYGFERFGNKSSPLIGPGGLGGPRGDGEFLQTIDTTRLEEGVHFLEARAFRHRTDNGPAVYNSFKKAFYVDRLPPQSAIQELRAVNNPGDTDVLVESVDFTADNVHVFLNLPASVADQEIYTMVSQGQGEADQVDVNLFKKYEPGIGTGNNVFTIVTYELTGTSNIQRMSGQWVAGRGAGLGDLNHDGQITADDMEGFGWGFEHVLYAQNTEFNPAADVNGDGRVDNLDLYSLEDVLVTAGASRDVLDAYTRVLVRRGNINGQFGTDQWDIDALYGQLGSEAWLTDLDADGGSADQQDVDTLVSTILGTDYGDANLDTEIDIADLQIVHDNWHGSTGWAGGDFTGDAFVDVADLHLVGLHWTSAQPYADAFQQVFGLFDAVHDAYRTDANVELAVAAPGVLGNDLVPLGDGISAVIADGPTHAAEFTLQADGSFSYTPAANFHGTDRFSYRADDGQAESNEATVTITVGAFQLDQLLPTPNGFVAYFNRPIKTAALSLYDIQAGTIGPADVTLTGSASGPVSGSLVTDANSVTFIATGGPLATDNYTVGLRSAASGFADAAYGDLLDGNADGTPGDDYTTAFAIAAEPIVVSLPDFTRGPGQPINVPAYDNDLPLTLTDRRDVGNAVTSLDLEVTYDPQLMNVTAATVGPDAPAGTTLVADTGTPGRITLSLSGATPFDRGESHVVTLTANVPAAATYGSSHVLDITHMVASDAGGTSLPATGDDAIHVVSLFGDTTGNGTYSGLDAQRAARVAVRLDGGFAMFPAVDPAIIADVTGNGSVSGLDAQRIAQQAAGTDPDEIPQPPELLRLDGSAAVGKVTDVLLEPQLTGVVELAAARIEANEQDHAAIFQDVTFRIANLPKNVLGMVSGHTIQVDINAAGYGWFVEKDEGRRTKDEGILMHPHSVDLLTAVMHELGHVLGYDHLHDGVMEELLPLGTRRDWDTGPLADETTDVRNTLDRSSLTPSVIDDYFAMH